MLHLLGDDGQAVRQNLTTNAAGFLYHQRFVSKYELTGGLLVLFSHNLGRSGRCLLYTSGHKSFAQNLAGAK